MFRRRVRRRPERQNLPATDLNVPYATKALSLQQFTRILLGPQGYGILDDLTKGYTLYCRHETRRERERVE